MPTSYSGSYTIPDGIKEICGGAFQNCSGLTSITIPKSVTSIGTDAFKGCTNITELNLNCPTVSNWFAGSNTKVQTVTLGENVTTIGYCAFDCFTGLTGITIPNSVTSIGYRAFSYCSGLTSVTIGNSVTSIGDYAFYYCSGLTSIAIPNSVTSIGSNTFYKCSGLTSITIGNSVTSIGTDAFNGCSTLKKITIGNEVSSIGANAFANCGKIEDVYCYAERYPSVATNAFSGSYVDYVTLHVPAKSVTQYKNHAVWGTFKEIVPISEEPVLEDASLTYTIDGYSSLKVQVKIGTTTLEISPKEGWTVATLTANGVNSLDKYSDGKLTIDIQEDTQVDVAFSWADQNSLYTEDFSGIVEIEGEGVKVWAKDGQIWVDGALGKTVRLYTIGGALITTVTPTAGMTGKFSLPAGTYIVQVGNKAAKVTVR